MSNSKKPITLEESLRNLWLQYAENADIKISEKELRLILTSTDKTFHMDAAKKEELINKLFNSVNSMSLGKLVEEAMFAKKIKLQKVAKETKIPSSFLQQILEDRIFPNNIPILLLKELLEKLSIPYKSAASASRKTFEIIKKNRLEDLTPGLSRMAARKQQEENTKIFRRMNGDQHGRELFENDESLRMYLESLGELMNEQKEI